MCRTWKEYRLQVRCCTVELGRNCRQALRVKRSNQRMDDIGEFIKDIGVRRLLNPFPCLSIDQLYAPQVFQVLEGTLDAVAIGLLAEIELLFSVATMSGLFLDLLCQL